MSFCDNPDQYNVKMILCKNASLTKGNVTSNDGDDEEEINIDTKKLHGVSAKFDMDFDENSTTAVEGKGWGNNSLSSVSRMKSENVLESVRRVFIDPNSESFCQIFHVKQ